MTTENTHDRSGDGEKEITAHFVDDAEPEQLVAWEQVDTGRYMPRRIKGSCKGRALG